ncbi:MAG: S1C family serine protease [Gemmatimonadota bacterium]
MRALRAPRALRTLAPLPLVAVLLAYPRPAEGQGAPREVREASAQVLTLRGYDAEGTQTAQGSGFFFGPGRIATNFHVIAGAERVVVIGIGGDTVATVTHVEAVDQRLDLAILGAPPGRSSGLTVETFVPDIGDPIWTYGSPKGLTGTMSNGILSALRQRRGRSVLQITAPISPGSSGGPVLDERGRVVGVTVSSILEGQNLNFAVPARELARLAARRAERVSLPVGEARLRRGGEGSEVSKRPVLQDRWQPLARTVSGAELLFDERSLRRQDDRIRVWIYTFYPATLMAGEAAFDGSKALFEMRCASQQFRLNQYLLLRGERVIGSSGSVSDGDWSAPAPDSIAETLMGRLCVEPGAAGAADAEAEPGAAGEPGA